MKQAFAAPTQQVSPRAVSELNEPVDWPSRWLAFP